MSRFSTKLLRQCGAAISKIEFDGVITYTAFIKDVTDEVEKREKMEMLSLVADHAKNGIVITDRDGKLIKK